MKFCYHCGNPLSLGTEKYCPECGGSLIPASTSDGNSSTGTKIYGTSTNISETSGDVIGSAISGTGNIIGKEVAYTVSGNVIHLHVENISARELKNIISRPVQLESKSDVGRQQQHYINTELNAKANEAKVTREMTEQVLKDIDQIGAEKGVHIEQIKVEELKVSRTELQLKDIISEGNTFYYQDKYNEAIDCFDKALEIDSNNVDAWNNKANALYSLGRYDEAIQCYDRALEIDEMYTNAWNNKGLALGKLGRYDEAIQYYDRTLELDKNYTYGWHNKGDALFGIGKYEEARKCYERANQLGYDPFQ